MHGEDNQDSHAKMGAKDNVLCLPARDGDEHCMYVCMGVLSKMCACAVLLSYRLCEVLQLACEAK